MMVHGTEATAENKTRSRQLDGLLTGDTANSDFLFLWALIGLGCTTSGSKKSCDHQSYMGLGAYEMKLCGVVAFQLFQLWATTTRHP